jgi:hypothetical protein
LFVVRRRATGNAGGRAREKPSSGFSFPPDDDDGSETGGETREAPRDLNPRPEGSTRRNCSIFAMVRPTTIERVTFARRGRRQAALCTRHDREEFEIHFVRRGIKPRTSPRPRADEDCGRVAEQIDVQVRFDSRCPVNSTSTANGLSFRSCSYSVCTSTVVPPSGVVLKAALLEVSEIICALSRNQSRNFSFD